MLSITESPPPNTGGNGAMQAWRVELPDGSTLRFESTLTQVFLRTSCCGGRFSYADEFLGSVPGPIGFLCCWRCRARTFVPEEAKVAVWAIEELDAWLEPLLDAAGMDPLQQVLAVGELTDHFKALG